MIELLFGTAFAILLRVLIGHLSIKYSSMSGSLIYFTIFAIVVAVITAGLLILQIVRQISRILQDKKYKPGKRRNT